MVGLNSKLQAIFTTNPLMLLIGLIMNKIKPGDFGSITYLDDGSFWIVQRVCELNLIVIHADNPKQWRACKPSDFWVLVNLN
jgi:hypothetical protein